MKKRIMTAGMLAMILAIGMTACTKADNTTKTEKTSESDGKKELKKSDDEKNVMNAEQKKIYEKIKLTYKEEEQKKVAEKLEKKKESQDYNLNNMLIEYNPFGTNTQSLYVYFKTDAGTEGSRSIYSAFDRLSYRLRIYIRPYRDRKRRKFFCTVRATGVRDHQQTFLIDVCIILKNVYPILKSVPLLIPPVLL